MPVNDKFIVEGIGRSQGYSIKALTHYSNIPVQLFFGRAKIFSDPRNAGQARPILDPALRERARFSIVE